jgi:hypothetical protein
VTPESAQKTNATAVIALVVGLLGFCFWGIGGIVSIVLGVVARREINRSEGREGGSGLALAGIVLGVLNVGSGVVAAGVAIAMMTLGTATTPGGGVPVARPAPAPTASAAPNFHADPEPRSRERATYERGVRETTLGKVRLVDVSPEKMGLRRALEQQQASARAARERLLLFVVTADCRPCNGVALALTDPRMQTALAGVRLVRVEGNAWRVELAALGVPIDSVPGFALLSDSLSPIDFVHGGEWDADIPENIAPVLGAFVRGRYLERRHRYRAAERPDETAL